MREKLGRTARNESYDERPLAQLSSEAIEFRVVAELLAPLRKITKKDMESLHLMVRHQRRLVPTCGGGTRAAGKAISYQLSRINRPRISETPVVGSGCEAV